MIDKTIRLGDVATYVNGYAFKPSDRGEVGLPIIRIQDLTGNAYDLGFYDGEYPKRIEINNGDILISWSASLGVYVWNRGKALLNQHIFKVVFDKANVDKDYFVYAIKYNLGVMESKAHGATMKHIVKKDFDNTLIPYPSLDEQKSIAQKLDLVSRVIIRRQQELDKLDELVKARFVELFGTINDDVPLSYYIASLNAGKSLAGEEECPNKVLKTGAVTYDYFDATQVKNLPLDYEPQEDHRVSAGDVIISRMNTAELVGAAAYVWDVPERVYLPDRLWRAEIKDTANAIFVWQVLIQSSTKESIRRIASGTSGSMKNISKPGLLGIRVVKAPKALQEQFAAFVEQTDKSKFVVQKALDEAQLLFDSLMQKYFG